MNGENRYVLTMHTFQEHDLRSANTGLTWAEIQKATAAAQGQANPLFTGALGMYRGVILHSHRNVIRFDTAGADGKQPAARAMFLGAQALVAAYGSPGSGLRFDWNEETEAAA
ncbi:MAG: N4-gp56 family major capsid protein [Rhodanobacteraceae bacterium]